MSKRLARAGVAQFQVALEEVEPPPELAYLLVWYHEIRRQNARGMHFEPILFVEILAYKTLYEIDMEPFDVDMLCQLDGLWCSRVPKAAEKGGK